MQTIKLDNGVTIEISNSRVILTSTDDLVTEVRFNESGKQLKTFLERSKTLLQLTKIYDIGGDNEMAVIGAEKKDIK